jgi:hypothetical protein
MLSVLCKPYGLSVVMLNVVMLSALASKTNKSKILRKSKIITDLPIKSHQSTHKFISKYHLDVGVDHMSVGRMVFGQET